jgi:lipopolysaccharide/colanic/teichoic acid biosynthesis glycosyltransferase
MVGTTTPVLQRFDRNSLRKTPGMLGNLRPSDAMPAIQSAGRKSSTTPALGIRVVDDTGLFNSVALLPWKRVYDIVAGSILALLLSPVLLLTIILVKITSPGPVFYTQTRLGRFGVPFVIWKIRSMRVNCEKKSGAIWSTKGDSRVTPIGKVLRKLHIDEFPQLWNVLKGDMSLVGPRPERPEFFPILDASVPDYPKRLLIKPGVTGLAQAYLPPDEDIESVRLKQIHDLYYIRNMGLWFDFRLMVITALQACGVPHFLIRPALFLPLPDSILDPTHKPFVTVDEDTLSSSDSTPPEQSTVVIELKPKNATT